MASKISTNSKEKYKIIENVEKIIVNSQPIWKLKHKYEITQSKFGGDVRQQMFSLDGYPIPDTRVSCCMALVVSSPLI